MKGENHYATLSVDRCASGEEIKRAYRTLAQRFHPDVTEDLDGERKFKEIGEAYRTLKRRETRGIYDQQIHNFCWKTPGVTDQSPTDLPTLRFNPFLWPYWSWAWAWAWAKNANPAFRN